MRPKRGLLLSAYAASSHQRWRKGITDHLSEITWVVLELPPRFFSWRFRGNAFTWAITQQELLNAEYDFLLATSMTDLATLKGLVPSLAAIPTIVYFHENQFVYPIQHEVVQREVFHFCMLNIYTALAGDVLLFNSEYNRQSLLQGIHQFLRKMPDHAPKKALPLITEKSRVLPVPLEDELFVADRTHSTLSILWNHRWEYDKAPERFFAAMYELKDRNINFTLHIVGQQFRKIPSIFNEAKIHLADHIRIWGYQESKKDYQQCLRNSTVVVSTALHEFQGLALLEAVAAGCYPLAPNRLAYPNFLPKECLYESYPDDRAKEMNSLLDRLLFLAQQDQFKAPSVDSFRWSNLAEKYRDYISNITTTNSQ